MFPQFQEAILATEKLYPMYCFLYSFTSWHDYAIARCISLTVIVSVRGMSVQMANVPLPFVTCSSSWLRCQTQTMQWFCAQPGPPGWWCSPMVWAFDCFRVDTAMLRAVEVLSFCSIRMAAQGWGRFWEDLPNSFRWTCFDSDMILQVVAWLENLKQAPPPSTLLSPGPILWSNRKEVCFHPHAQAAKRSRAWQGHLQREKWMTLKCHHHKPDAVRYVISCAMYLAANPVWSWLAMHRPSLRRSIWQQCNRWQVIERSSHLAFRCQHYTASTRSNVPHTSLLFEKRMAKGIMFRILGVTSCWC